MIYLDNAATTKPSKAAVSAAQEYNEIFFNPSALYRGGVGVKKDIERAGECIAEYAGKGFEAVFTSGGTESDNLAVSGGNKKGRIIASAAEHAAVYNSMRELAERGYDAVFAPVRIDGCVDLEKLLRLVDARTSFVSVVHVNNETGAINDINQIAKAVKEISPGCAFHSDGVQGFGKIPVKLTPDIDFYSVSAHKIGGLKGTGALLKRKKANLKPLIFGGGQEKGLRSGTENVSGIMAFQAAANERFDSLEISFERASRLNRILRDRLKEEYLIISPDAASPYILSFSLEGGKAEVLQHMLEEEGILLGTGSACSKNKHSRILSECGLSDKILDGALRISLSPENTDDEIVFATEKLLGAAIKHKRVMRI